MSSNTEITDYIRGMLSKLDELDALDKLEDEAKK